MLAIAAQASAETRQELEEVASQTQMDKMRADDKLESARTPVEREAYKCRVLERQIALDAV